MTSWSDVERYINANYKAEKVSDDLFRLVFNTGNLRSQIVYIARDATTSGTEWLRVNSPIGNAVELDLAKAAASLASKIVGGLVIYGDMAHVTNSIPLANLDSNELIEPLEKVMSIADALEAELLGVDDH